jgi:hypothetical protein
VIERARGASTKSGDLKVLRELSGTERVIFRILIETGIKAHLEGKGLDPRVATERKGGDLSIRDPVVTSANLKEKKDWSGKNRN